MHKGIIFDNAKDFSEGRACVEINGKWGIINLNGEIILDFCYESLHRLSKNHYVAKLNGKQGLIDPDGSIIIDFLYDSIWFSDFGTDFLEVELNGKSGIIDRNNNIIFDIKYDFPRLRAYYDNKYTAVCMNDKVGLLDINKNIILPFEYDCCPQYKKDRFIVCKDGQYGLVDLGNNIIIHFEYSRMNFWTDGNYCVKTPDEKHILINEKQQKICKWEFDYLDFPYWGQRLIPAGIGDKYGFIDTNGEFKINFNYDDAWPFTGGPGHVCINDKWGLIDENENVIIPFEYDNPYFDLQDNFLTAQKDDKWGIIDYDNNIIVDFVYESEGGRLLSFSEGFAIVMLNNKFGYIDKNGEILIPKINSKVHRVKEDD